MQEIAQILKNSTLKSTTKRKYRFNTWIYTGGATKEEYDSYPKVKQIEVMKKAWYIGWSFEDDKGAMKRRTNLKLNGNRVKGYEERFAYFKNIQEKLLWYLGQGYNPNKVTRSLIGENFIYEAFQKALKAKQRVMKESSFQKFRSRVNQFERYLKINGLSHLPISDITKRDVVDFLNEVHDRTSSRNRNNTRTDLATFFQAMEDEGLIRNNFVKSIPKVPTKPQKNKAFTTQEVDQIFTHLEKANPNLLLFVKFVSYSFLRPIEVARLKIGDIDFDNNTLSVFVKQGRIKKKIIPSILMREIESYKGLPSSHVLFTVDGFPGERGSKPETRRGYFSDQFKQVKKDLGFGANYGIYSFRHSFTVKIYRKMRQNLTPFETKSRLMLITGHDSMKALEKYLREIDAELPEDYSDLLS